MIFCCTYQFESFFWMTLKKNVSCDAKTCTSKKIHAPMMCCIHFCHWNELMQTFEVTSLVGWESPHLGSVRNQLSRGGEMHSSAIVFTGTHNISWDHRRLFFLLRKQQTTDNFLLWTNNFLKTYLKARLFHLIKHKYFRSKRCVLSRFRKDEQVKDMKVLCDKTDFLFSEGEGRVCETGLKWMQKMHQNLFSQTRILESKEYSATGMYFLQNDPCVALDNECRFWRGQSVEKSFCVCVDVCVESFRRSKTTFFLRLFPQVTICWAPSGRFSEQK